MTRRLSINNGRTFITPIDLSDVDLEYNWPELVEAMDLRTCADLWKAGETGFPKRAFLAAYLERAPTDLIIG